MKHWKLIAEKQAEYINMLENGLLRYDLNNPSFLKTREELSALESQEVGGMSAEEWFYNHFDCYADLVSDTEVIPALTKTKFLEYAQQSSKITDEKQFHQNTCHSCKEPMSNDCDRCKRLWES